MLPPIPSGWLPILEPETVKPYYRELQAFLERERAEHSVFPPEPDVFHALDLTPYHGVKVMILGQDPYHAEGQAHGLAFSVQSGVPPPPSLKNIFHELNQDVGARIPNHGTLVSWAAQGVLLLNAVLTVRAHQPGSHQGKGWEIFTDTIIHSLGKREEPLVFVLWGNFARKKLPLIDNTRSRVIAGPHPCQGHHRDHLVRYFHGGVRHEARCVCRWMTWLEDSPWFPLNRLNGEIGARQAAPDECGKEIAGECALRLLGLGDDAQRPKPHTRLEHGVCVCKVQPCHFNASTFNRHARGTDGE